MIVLKKVLVATDFGPASESALRYAQALARGFAAELHVLHVVENLLTRAIDGYGYAAISPEVQLDVETAGRNQTEALLNDEDRRELRAKASTVTSNSPATEIVDYARATRVARARTRKPFGAATADVHARKRVIAAAKNTRRADVALAR